MTCKSQSPVLAILVLYKVPLAKSSSYRTLCIPGKCIPIAVYDNSPTRQVTDQEERRLLAYRHDSRNSGIAAAYNWALELANSIGMPWLLLLDQDSELPHDYFESAVQETRKYRSDPRVAAIVPRVRSGREVVSPARVAQFSLRRHSALRTGKQTAEISAINSGAVIRCSFMTSIGGFDQAYWLDFLDHWMFAQIYRNGFYAALTEVQITHALSAHRPHEYSLERYKNILSGERRLVSSFQSPTAMLLYRMRLLARAVKQLLQYRRPDLSRITLQAMCQ